uniref:LCCL domain-containing protein n=1 Tax=Bursaphelenchus xylophilus TaxID=6326 RepID=A0A1I7SHV3_BURXY
MLRRESQDIRRSFFQRVGTATSIGVTYTDISRLGSPYGECTDTKPDGYLFSLAYSTEGCQRSNYQTNMVSNCGCYDPAYPKPNSTDTMCTIEDNYDCWNQQSNHTGSDYSCTQPCHEGTYEVTVSSAKWPSSSLTIIGECEEGEYGNQTCLEMYTDNGALIEVYYEKLNYETMEESAAYTVSTLLSNFGGQIGLWLGMSVISVIEFFVLAFQ